MFNIIVSEPDVTKYVGDEVVKGVIVQIDSTNHFYSPLTLGDENTVKYEFIVNGAYAPNTIIYVRARYAFEHGGLQGWSDVTAVVVRDKLNIQINFKEPIVTKSPVITPMLNFEVQPEIGLGFNVEIPPFVDRVSHMNYVITDDSKQQTAIIEAGMVVDFNKIIPHNRLKPSRNYTIRACYVFDTGAISMFGGCSFVTGANVGLIYYLRTGAVFVDGALDHYTIGGVFDFIRAEVIKDGVVVYGKTQDIANVHFDSHTPEAPYAIKTTPIINNVNGNPIFMYVTNKADTSNRLPAMITYTL